MTAELLRAAAVDLEAEGFRDEVTGVLHLGVPSSSQWAVLWLLQSTSQLLAYYLSSALSQCDAGFDPAGRTTLARTPCVTRAVPAVLFISS